MEKLTLIKYKEKHFFPNKYNLSRIYFLFYLKTLFIIIIVIIINFVLVLLIVGFN